MIQSMTGYGKSEVELLQKSATIEIRTLNSKNIDFNIRVPNAYREKEPEIRNLLATQLKRGKVDFTLTIENNEIGGHTSINEMVVSHYLGQLSKLGLSDKENMLNIAMRLPDVLKTEVEDINDDEWIQITDALLKTIEKVITFRKDEGLVLKKDFSCRIDNIQQLTKQIDCLDEERLKNIRERLYKAIEELKQSVDENRFEQELIYYLEKLDVTEEKVRLRNHLSYFLDELNNPTSNGKKLGFIGQEIGREINTLGSKANFAPMQKIVVQMKDELEKIKEQLLNVL